MCIESVNWALKTLLSENAEFCCSVCLEDSKKSHTKPAYNKKGKNKNLNTVSRPWVIQVNYNERELFVSYRSPISFPGKAVI